MHVKLTKGQVDGAASSASFDGVVFEPFGHSEIGSSSTKAQDGSNICTPEIRAPAVDPQGRKFQRPPIFGYLKPSAVPLQHPMRWLDIRSVIPASGIAVTRNGSKGQQKTRVKGWPDGAPAQSCKRRSSDRSVETVKIFWHTVVDWSIFRQGPAEVEIAYASLVL